MSRLSKTVRQMFVICGLLFIGGISSVRAAAAPKANIAGAKRAVKYSPFRIMNVR